MEGRTGCAWRTDRGGVKMRNLKVFYHLSGEKKGQEDTTARKMLQTMDQVTKVFDEFCDCRKTKVIERCCCGDLGRRRDCRCFLTWNPEEERKYTSMPQTMAIVNTHISRLKPYSTVAGLLGLLQCGLTSGNRRVKISNNQKNLKQVGWAKRLRCRWSLRDHQNTVHHRRKKKCPTDSFSKYK